MRIAIFSDSHDNIWKLESAIPHLTMADVVVHCGDIISPFMVLRLINNLDDKPVHLVWGNNDGDKRLLTEVAASAENIHIHGDFGHIELGGFTIGIIHYPNIARALAESGTYNLVCYGHDHTAYQSWIGNTLLLNPGELMGMNNKSTIAVFDTVSKKVETIEIR